MKKKLLFILTVVFIVALMLSACEKEEQMAINFNADSYLNFGSVSQVNALSAFSVCLHYVPSAVNVTERTFLANGSAGGIIFSHSDGGSNGNLRLVSVFSTTSGVWITTDNLMSAGNHYDICLTYDATSTSNDPKFYVNGVSATVSETSTPAGTFEAISGNLYVGYPDGYGLNGVVSGVRFYNRILTADEVMQIYTARGADNIKNGLVFCPVLYGAKGVQVFDGATLTTSNLIVDPCSGATGVPTGSPVAAGETYLIVKPH